VPLAPPVLDETDWNVHLLNNRGSAAASPSRFEPKGYRYKFSDRAIRSCRITRPNIASVPALSHSLQWPNERINAAGEVGVCRLASQLDAIVGRADRVLFDRHARLL